MKQDCKRMCLWLGADVFACLRGVFCIEIPFNSSDHGIPVYSASGSSACISSIVATLAWPTNGLERVWMTSSNTRMFCTYVPAATRQVSGILLHMTLRHPPQHKCCTTRLSGLRNIGRAISRGCTSLFVARCFTAWCRAWKSGRLLCSFTVRNLDLRPYSQASGAHTPP